MNGCTLRSDGSVSLSGNLDLVAPGIYAGSTISTSGNAHITGTKYPDSGQISDPYATDTQLQDAFAQLTTQTTSRFSGGGSAAPGTYASMSITANTTLSPGLYVVTGNFSVSGNASVSGSGATIIDDRGCLTSWALIRRRAQVTWARTEAAPDRPGGG